MVGTSSPGRHVVLMGPPGGGKGTLAGRLKRERAVTHVAAGDLVRAWLAGGPGPSDDRETAKQQVADGELLSASISMAVVRARLEELVAQDHSWVLEGFPRTLDQAKLLRSTMHEMCGQSLSGVFVLEVPQEAIVERVAGRRVHLPSGRTYHVTYRPPKNDGRDDETGEELVQRPDDREEVVLRRLALYHRESDPIEEYYEDRGLLHRIPSPTSDEGWVTLSREFDQL